MKRGGAASSAGLGTPSRAIVDMETAPPSDNTECALPIPALSRVVKRLKGLPIGLAVSIGAPGRATTCAPGHAIDNAIAIPIGVAVSAGPMPTGRFAPWVAQVGNQAAARKKAASPLPFRLTRAQASRIRKVKVISHKRTAKYYLACRRDIVRIDGSLMRSGWRCEYPLPGVVQ
jgi:hypothetical protein